MKNKSGWEIKKRTRKYNDGTKQVSYVIGKDMHTFFSLFQKKFMVFEEVDTLESAKEYLRMLDVDIIDERLEEIKE